MPEQTPFRFDRAKFFTGYKSQFGANLSQSQVDGMNFILDSIELDRYITRLEWIAYMFATTKLETAHTFQPIHEYGGHAYFVRRYGSQTAVGKRLGNETPEDGATYAGEGDVQLTGKHNFEKAEDALLEQYPELVAAFEARTGKMFDLTAGDQPNDQDDPANAGDPAIAYAIMSYGMRTGMFTSKRLSDYLSATKKDYRNARRIINTLDRADIIAGYAVSFEIILRNALMISNSTVPDPAGSKSSPPSEPANTAVESPGPEVVSPTASGNGDNVAAQTAPTSAPSQPAATSSLWDRVAGYQTKLDQVSQLKNSLNPFTPSLSPISGTSGVTTASMHLGGWPAMIWGFITGNWEYIVAGLVLIALGVGYLALAKRNAAKRTSEAATALLPVSTTK